MKVTIFFRYTFLCFLLLSASSCGFSLRSGDVLSANYNDIQLLTEQNNSELTRLLRRRLENSGVSIQLIDSNDADLQKHLLSLGEEKLKTRPISVNPRARAAQHEIRLTLEIALSQAGEFLISPETLYVERAYLEDIENLNGNQEELEIIVSEMRRELVNQLIRRLSASANQVSE